jgi:drug/metabolite transporter (DMT)-like permease
MTPLALNLVRIIASVSLFWLLFLLRPRKFGIHRADLPRFLLCALTGVVINQLFFVKGLSLTSSIHASLLALGTPIFISTAAAWLLCDRFTWQKAFGLALGIAGAFLLISSRSHAQGGSEVWLGDLLIVVNSLSYALYFVLVKPLMAKYPAIHLVRWVFTLGGVLMLPICLPDFLNTPFSALPLAGWAAMLFVSVGATFFAYLFNVYGLKHLGPGATGAYIYTQPLFASIIGILFLAEPFGWLHLMAGGLIAAGVLLSANRPAWRS